MTDYISREALINKLKRDPFYIEDDESMRLIEKCANECSPYHKPPKE